MKAYSPALRSKLVAAVDAGRSKAEVARVFGVSISTVKRYLKQHRETGSLVPKRHPGRAPIIRPDQRPVLWAQLEAHPAAFLDEHRDHEPGDPASGVDPKKRTLGATE